MKSRNREPNIFNMSALDLFASAMGAFILIAFVLFPYFPNTGDSAEIARLEQDQARLEKEKTKLQQDQARLEQENAKLKQDIDNTSILLGIKTTAKKFVIVVDMSGSIEEYRDFVKLSVQEMLSSFKSEIELVLIGFHAPNHVTRLHFWPENRQYFQVWQNTRGHVISKINDWMTLVDGGTPTREALIEALALNPEEIILLSDGAPSEEWQDVVRITTSQNVRRIPIHAVAIGNYVGQRQFIDFLIQLTEQNGGYLVGAKPG